MSDIEVKNASGAVTVALRGQTAAITAGASGTTGSVSLSDAAGTRAVLITAGPGSGSGPVWKAPAERLTLDGEHGTIIAGGAHAAGACFLTSANGAPTVQLQGDGGRITLADDQQRASVTLDGKTADVTIGRKDNAGRVVIDGGSGEPIITLDGKTGDVAIGRKDNGGRVFLHDKTGAATVTIDGTTGDITLANADCAEEFDVAEAAQGAGLAPGTVVVLDHDGAVRACGDAYDGQVAGVVSGAGDYRPALVLDRRAGAGPRVPVALMGKVHCWVDADAAPVRPGDLLTTSATPGHAQRATDRARAFGAVVGKALAGLERGRGLVPVLVTLT
jgi:hypothetical protein